MVLRRHLLGKLVGPEKLGVYFATQLLFAVPEPGSDLLKPDLPNNKQVNIAQRGFLRSRHRPKDETNFDPVLMSG